MHQKLLENKRKTLLTSNNKNISEHTAEKQNTNIIKTKYKQIQKYYKKPPILYLPKLPKFKYIIRPLTKPLREPWIEKKKLIKQQKNFYIWERKINFEIKKTQRVLQKQLNKLIKK